MKRVVGILVSVIMSFSLGTTALAAPDSVADTDTTVEYHDGLSLELSYDDRYDLSELIGSGASVEYIQSEDSNITSYQVKNGEATVTMDTALLTLIGGTEVAATGVGTGTVQVVRANNVYEIEVTVTPAPLTLMFMAGQSNMEGYCDSYTGYTPDASIACKEGSVYSTYVPWGASKGKEITGIDFSKVCSSSNYKTTAGDFVAGSLQGAVTEDMLHDPLNMAGGTLEYPVDSLTSAGNGKTGPDSGLAYEWNQRVGDKVWVVNTAYGATEIAQWVPGGTCYDRSAVIWEKVLQTYDAELSAGHYTAGSKLVFWQQGEMSDATNPATQYEDYFDTMYNAMEAELDMDAFGFLMVRAGYATNRGADYRSEADIKMSNSRIAQYWLGSGNSPYGNVYVATNANEQWVSDSGVQSYFKSRYGSSLSYPTQGGGGAVPTTVDEVHYDIHYSQIGHNENGITAADGMFEALNGSAMPGSVSWRGGDGKAISSLTLALSTDTAIAVPVADPAYATKQITTSYEPEYLITYDAPSGIVAAVSEETIGTQDLVANAGGITVTLPVTVSTSLDLSKEAGAHYNGLYLYNGIWWYLEDGIIQPDYAGLVEYGDSLWYVENGRVRFDYTGFAQKGDDWWYVENSVVTFDRNDVIKDTAGAIGEAGTWYYVDDGKVHFDYNGFAANSNGDWYIENGKVTFTKQGVLKDTAGAIGKAGTWYYVDGSKVHFDYNGFAANSNGKWYIENGIVTFSLNSVLKDTTGAIGTKGTWYYVVGSKVQTDFTGLADYKNNHGWWYIRNGEVDFTANTVAKNKNGWWYIEGGKVIFSYNGFGENSNGKWYLEGGKVNFDVNIVLKDSTGAIGEKGTWYYVVGSKVQTDFTGLADYKNSHGWWYIKNGVVDFTENTVAKNKNGWWYVVDGKVQFGFTGLADYKNNNGWWYIKDGKVDFTHNGVDKNKNGWWYVADGKVRFGFTGLADYRNAHGWWYIKEGKVDFTHSGVDKNKNGWWYIKDGKVDFSFSGKVTVSGIIYSVTDGKVAR